MTKREAKMLRLLADFCNWHCRRLGGDRLILESNTDNYTERAFDILVESGCAELTGMNLLAVYHKIDWVKLEELMKEASE